MKKVILPIFLLVSLLILSGCNAPQQKTEPIQSTKSEDQTMNTAPTNNNQLPTIDEQSTIQEENNIDLDREINDLDQSLQQTSDTDFSENELSDSNLGI